MSVTTHRQDSTLLVNAASDRLILQNSRATMKCPLCSISLQSVTVYHTDRDTGGETDTCYFVMTFLRRIMFLRESKLVGKIMF